ncbi:aldolase [Nocardia farcinica]|uniref:S-methyl-5-thioribose-1-phosphate isomerase n=1 Tax=Nocardia farcinica TaxID=37329 RepID=UPI000DFE6A2F|nr:S-methyl-5-thioribose-1-phosphate isomerase [Nocardia farcinica]SUE30084.1 aldolase [Nocardia farcinica]
MRRSVDWVDGEVHVVDQRALPGEYRIARLGTVEEVVAAIRTLTVRGAPAIGAAGALAVALSARAHGADLAAVRAEAEHIAAARPTAVNLAWAVRRVLARLPDGPAAVLAEALALLDEDERVDREMSARAADEVRALCGPGPVRVLTHCNTGRFATVGWGTALGTVRELARRGELDSVLAGETRPLLQGARLTTWELAEAGIPHRICVDSAGPGALATGAVDCVLVGADRITALGDVANKIGTYPLALAAARAGVPFVVVAPESTVDESLTDPAAIVLEERDPAEVTTFAGVPVAPSGTAAYNPAFDVTPRDLVTAIVTERRTLRPALGFGVPAVAAQLYGRGWLDGTAGNLSVRLDADRALVTASGRSKGALTAADLITVDLTTGAALDAGARPSAETSIHAALYRAVPGCGAVVHAHPPAATTAATLLAAAGTVVFDDFEIVKGFGPRPAGPFTVPVLTNHAEVPRIAADLAARLTPDAVPAALIDRHGATTWGPDLETARNRMECLEMLCALQLRTGGDRS